jgi:hypothetical protein
MEKDSGDSGGERHTTRPEDAPLAWPWSQYKGELPRDEPSRWAAPAVETVAKGTNSRSLGRPALLLTLAFIVIGGLTWRLASAPDSATPQRNEASAPSEETQTDRAPALQVDRSSSDNGGATSDLKSPPAQAQDGGLPAAAHSDQVTLRDAPEKPKTDRTGGKKHKKAAVKTKAGSQRP